MAGYNRVIIVGNLTRDPELKQLPSGMSVCRLSIASNRQFKNRQTGAMVQDVCYVDVDVWGAQAESCNQYLQKGRPALIEGRLKFDSWKDGEGNTRSKHSIVADSVQFLGYQEQSTGGDTDAQAPKATAQSSSNEQFVPQKPVTPQAAPAPQVNTQKFDEPPFEDDLPF